MIYLKDFQERRELLETWYDRVLEAHELLQVDDNGLSGLREEKENLRAGRFILAICGQMNSGKSTLLNALLFKNEVLPSAATTATAKITLMERNEKESVVATFYTHDEFRSVENEIRKDRQAAKELSKARKSATAAGLRESQLLTDPAHVEQRDGLDDLHQFAAVSGKYNVYVKSVLLRADLDWLDQVMVADTPGTNDPNPVRDSITHDWIRRADAVVYVTFAGHAGMDNEDVKFIDEHLAHVRPTHRIIAVNKCDEDETKGEAIWSHIRKIQDSGDLRQKNLFRNDDQIVLVSGLGALIAAMQDAGRPLSEDMQWHAKDMSDKGYPDRERHGVEKLRCCIERSIIANRGESIIEAHQRRIANLFKKAIRSTQEKDKLLRDKLKESCNDRSKREKRRVSLHGDISQLDGRIRDLRRGLAKSIDNLHSTLDQSLSGIKRKIMENLEEQWLKHTIPVDELAKQAHWGIQSVLYDQRSEITKHVRNLMNGIEKDLDVAEIALSDHLMRSGFGFRGVRTHLLPLSPRDICKNAEKELDEKLNQEGLAKTVHDATNWWQRLLNTARGRKMGRDSLRVNLDKGLKDALDHIPGTTSREMAKLAEEALGSMEERYKKIQKERLNQLDELEKEDASDEEVQERINTELADLAEQRKRIEVLQDEYVQG